MLIRFWTGWGVPPENLFVEVSPDVTLPVASTCLVTLKLPLNCQTYKTFKDNLNASVKSSEFGFGLV